MIYERTIYMVMLFAALMFIGVQIGIALGEP